MAFRHDPELRQRYNLALFALFLISLFFLGGASRADALSQPFIRILAILMIVSALVQMDTAAWRRVKAPTMFLLGFAIITVVQLVPLPAGIWRELSGRAPYAEALEMGGLAAVSRPISLTPDLTLNTLLSTLPALGASLTLGLLGQRSRELVLPLLIGGVVLSAFLALLQIATGAPYFYAVTNLGHAVGILANRNHQALFVALALPMLALWVVLASGQRERLRFRMGVAVCIAAAVFPLLLVTGSRGGLVVGLAGLILSAIFLYVGLFPGRDGRKRRPSRAALLAWAIPIAILVVTLIAFIAFARDEALQRLTTAESDTDIRAKLLPTFAQMVWDFFPAGAGFGSFDAVFRAYEPSWALKPTYLNHAHNDLAQLLIEGGAPALLLLLLFFAWFFSRAASLWFGDAETRPQLLGRAGSIMVAMILLASLLDYPLRTPLISVLFGIACVWMVRLPHPPTSPNL